MKDILQLSASKAIGKAPRTAVVASSSWISAVPDAAWEAIPELRVLPTESSAAVTADMLRDIELVVLEVDANERATLERVAAIKRARPNLPIVAAVQNADMRVMRVLLQHGVSDAIALPFDLEQLVSEIYDIGAQIAESHAVPLAPTAAFIGVLGQCGTTSILVHLANALAQAAEHPIRCCVIDLDMQAGQLAAHAGLTSTRSMLHLLEAEERLDRDMIRNVATKSQDGVYIISAPQEILPIEQIDVDQLLRIIELAREEFDVVLLDMPRGWTNWSLSVAASADNLVLVTEQSLSHLRQARRCLDLFREVGISPRKVKVLVNRASKSRFRNITLQDVADTLERDVIASIREDRGELAQANDEGKLVSEINRRAMFAKDIDELAYKFEQLLEGGKA